MLYLVTAYRYGNIEGAQYHVWAGTDPAEAERQAEQESWGRGQKYGCQVTRAVDMGATMRFEPVYYATTLGEDAPGPDYQFHLGLRIHAAVAGGAVEVPPWLADAVKRIEKYGTDFIAEPEASIESDLPPHDRRDPGGRVFYIVAAHPRGWLNAPMVHVWAGEGAAALQTAEAVARSEVERTGRRYGCRVVAGTENADGMWFDTLAYFPCGAERGPFWSPYVEAHSGLAEVVRGAVAHGSIPFYDEQARKQTSKPVPVPAWLAAEVKREPSQD
jgi:hypothetical protein